MGRTGKIKAGEAFVELSLHDRTQRALGRAQARLKRFGRDTAALGRSMLTVGAAALGPLAGALKTFSNLGDSTAKMARRTGLAVEAVQSLGFAAERSGASTESLEKGVRRMQRTVWDATRGLSTANDALDELGLTADDLAGKSPEEQFKVLADALHGVDGASRRAAIAQQIFGRSGTELLPMFEKGRAGLEALQERFESLGVTLSSEETQAAERFTDQLTNLWTGLKYGVALIGSRLEPAIRDLLSTGQETIREWAGWVKENRTLITQYAKLALRVWKWVALLGGGLLVVGKFAGAIGSLIGVVKSLSAATAALIANPVALAFVGAAAVVGGTLVAMERLSAAQADVAAEARNYRQQQDRQRQADLDRIERLQTLAEKERLSANEQKRAADLINTLESDYGDLGLAIDETTGKITGLAEAQRELTERMRDARIVQLTNEIGEYEQNIKSLRAESERIREGWAPAEWWRKVFGGEGQIEQLGEQTQEQMRRLGEAQRELERLQGGATGREALTGQDSPEAAARAAARHAEDAAKSRADTVQRLADELARAEIQAIDDAHERRMAMIRQEFEERLRALREEGASEEAIQKAREIRDTKLATERKRHEKEVAEERQRAIEEMFAEEGEKADKWFREQQAEADEASRAADRAAERARKGADVAASVRGTFGANVRGLAVGSTAERTAKASEQTAKNTKEIRRQMQNGTLAFAP